MKVHSVQNYNINTVPQFRGSVSPEFVKYVNEVRKDCLQAYPKHRANFINIVCDNIINKAQKVMKNCFPQESVLSVDTTKSPTEDFIVYSNKVLYKYIPEDDDYKAYYITKKEKATPVSRFVQLYRAIISGYAFAGASVKDYVRAFIMTDYYKDCNMRNESFSKDCIPLFEFYYNKIHLLKSETNAEKHCRLRTQDDYAKLLSDMKEIS